MALPDAPTLTRKLADAKREAQTRLEAWQCYQTRKVSDSELSELRGRIEFLRQQLIPLEAKFRDGRFARQLTDARARVSYTKRDRDALFDSNYFSRARWLRFHSKRMFFARLFKDDSIGWFPAALFIATFRFALTVPCVIFFSTNYWWIFGIAGFVFLISFVWPACVLRNLDCSEFANNPTALRDWVTTRNSDIETASNEYALAKDDFRSLDGIRKLHDEHEAAKSDLPRLEEINARQKAYEVAVAEVKRLEAIQATRQYQLAATDWASLRGVAFENFLAEVFRALGYEVELTKASGDQGVDLLLTGKGRRVAVQAKGYSNSVGNDAVQAVFAGKRFYGCHDCVVITNSTFTNSARELATKVSCRLIDSTAIPALIAGDIL